MIKNLLLLIFPVILFSQSPDVDIIIETKIYKSYFDNDIRQPLQLSYILHKGGGDCDRRKFRFIDDKNIKTTGLQDYQKTGFDMGHLANAEDFAYDCKKGELTFRFYNCLPQYPNLNRGVWKKWEAIIRKESQTDSLLIICGAQFTTKNKINQLYIPDNFYKIVYSLKTKQVKWVLWFKHVDIESEKSLQIIKLEELFERLGYTIDLKY